MGLRIVALSDTHGYHTRLKVPDGDVLIHAGDFSMRAQRSHVREFAHWFKQQPHKHKIIVPGNHDVACDGHRLWAAEEFNPVQYLDHESCLIEGYTVFGSPYTSSIQEPSYWSFDYPRYGAQAKHLWGTVPDHVDILVTHGPPHKIMDRVPCAAPGEDPNVGDPYLMSRIEQILPRVHIFGHIHEGYGSFSTPGLTTKFYNVCVCDGYYTPSNPITVIDL